VNPLGSTQALDPDAIPPALRAPDRAAPAAPWGAQPAAARPGDPLRLTPTHVDDDDDDDVRTVLREGPGDGVSPAALRPAAGVPAFGQAPAYPAAGAGAPSPFGQAAGARPAQGAPPFGQPSGGAALGAAQVPPGAFPPPATLAMEPGRPAPKDPSASAGGLLGPSLVESFGVGRRLADPKGAPPSPFTQPQQPSGQLPPSPFASPGGGLLVPDAPPPSNKRGLIAVIVIALLVAALVALFAMRTGALGARPAGGAARLCVLAEGLDLRVEAPHVDAQQERGPEA
jgi:protein transport protein SEC31